MTRLETSGNKLQQDHRREGSHFPSKVFLDFSDATFQQVADFWFFLEVSGRWPATASCIKRATDQLHFWRHRFAGSDGSEQTSWEIGEDKNPLE